ncbi:peptidase M50 protein [Halorhabdus tiamatea SARL4B]|uniref:Peptidase M50 n=1 Tax=Halorhabdus tiamatea SARL4B TaxID=1033806 RepID=F7PJK4_9EURY|nr:site-2 protease family protein [Halorhabdus tiamatea]ERJ06249.1 peptidase M50 protein [Halorhabdus tiamatea SARL4B]CCQ33809.1 peptidase M50 [Halorhabdus tiamatea SARL4B]
MSPEELSSDPPGVGALSSVFHVYRVERDGEEIQFVGEPLIPPGTLSKEVTPLFAQRGYDVEVTRRHGDGGPAPYALVAQPESVGIDGIPWGNLVMFVLTVATTLYAGTWWYHIDLAGDPLNLLEAWPFTAAVLGVLATHELGHYVLSRYHGVDASLPYFIPVPPPIGTMGAIIRMRGQIPSRKALFDIGVAGPLAGLAATIVVTVVGLHLDPISVPAAAAQPAEGAASIQFNDPPLLTLLAELVGQPLTYDDPTKAVNPVVFGGWVGMFVTFLNLIPVGQLDGGHILRAALGRRQETVAAAVPGVLFAMAGGLYFLTEYTQSTILWGIWGVIALVMVRAGSATPLREGSIGNKRLALAGLTFLAGALCFMPVPIEIVMA